MSRRVCSNACVSRAHIKTIHSPKDDTPPLGKEDAVRAEVQREKRRRFRGQTSSPKKGNFRPEKNRDEAGDL